MENEHTKVAILLENNQIKELEVANLPSVLGETFERIAEYDSKKQIAKDKAEKAKSSTILAKEKDASRSFKDKKKIAIEALQQALLDTCEAQDAIVDALSESFEFQKKMSNAIEYLFGLGCMNMAANRMVVRELEMKLKSASEEELSELAREELNKVLLQLKAQQDLLDRIEKHKEAIGDLRDGIIALRKEVEYQKENNQLNKKISKYQNCIKLSLIVSLIATTIAAVGFFI